MTFQRRGNVSFPHRPSAKIDLTRIDRVPVTIYLHTISCFEEYRFNALNEITVIFFTNGSSMTVAEDFDAIESVCRKWEVANV